MGVLKVGPAVQPRQEVVPVPEWGGDVLCRGLLASEAFAVDALRQQALVTLNAAKADYRELVKALPEGAPPPPFEPPAMSYAEFRAYGLYTSHLLAAGVCTDTGLALYTVDQWEVMGQHHPGVMDRLQAVVERLSGLDAEDVRKNSPPTPASGPGSGSPAGSAALPPSSASA